MIHLPVISVIVPSFNQAKYLPETLQSLVDQEYPLLEVIIQDGGSSDGSVEIAEDFARKYPDIFRVFVEKDNGQADALNHGFARAKGEVMAFLNSDDTYFPRILHRIAAEIDPKRERFVVMGRCIFTGEGSGYVGVEHPAEYQSHFQQLAIWNRGFNAIPQPSVFWHRQVWERCGGLDVNEQHALDYDLFCRFSRHYKFHRIDELFSTYRMHDSSKSSQLTEAEVLELAIQVSRKHWGAWYEPLRWRCRFSYWHHNQQLHERARHHARRAEEAFFKQRYQLAALESLRTFVTAPRMARDRLLYGLLAAKGVRFFKKLAIANEVFTGRYADGWIGPIYREQLEIPEDATNVVIYASHYPRPKHKKIKIHLTLDGVLVTTATIVQEGDFTISVDAIKWSGHNVLLELRVNSCFVPPDLPGGDTKRLLSLKLEKVEVI